MLWFVLVYFYKAFHGFGRAKFDDGCSVLGSTQFSILSQYHKLVETFHVVSECNTAFYFSWCLIQAHAQPVQLFWPLVTFSVASGNCLTDSDLQLFIETEQDRTRQFSILSQLPLKTQLHLKKVKIGSKRVILLL